MEEWEFQERLWKAITHAAGYVIGAITLFALLALVAKYSQGSAQDPFTIICQQAADSKRRGAK